MQVPTLTLIERLTLLPPVMVQPPFMQPIHQPLHGEMPANVTVKTVALGSGQVYSNRVSSCQQAMHPPGGVLSHH